MTSPIRDNFFIKINLRDTMKQQKEMKNNRWNGYNIKIIKDSKDAMEQLEEVLLRRKIHRNMGLGVCK